MTLTSPRNWDKPGKREPANSTGADSASTGRETGDPFLPTQTFGAGGSEPYAQALKSDDNVLYLHGLRSDAAPGTAASISTMHASRWSAEADAVDRSLLAGMAGPVLDIGCGPGRMIQAALDAGLDALGVDVSPTAVQIALTAGLAVLHRSVFDHIPLAGTWSTLLLVDGNIGIGGDPDALLGRCAFLLAVDGVLVVEVHRDPEHDLTYEGTLHDASGNASDPFPWAEIGVHALGRRAQRAGLVPVADWTAGGRSFARFARA